MPHLASKRSKIKKKKIFAWGDFWKGFWQLPLDEDSQEPLSFQTDEGTYTPTRVPQGHVDSALHFQATMENCFAPMLYEKVLIWVDDLLMFAEDYDDYFESLVQLLETLSKYNLKINAQKTKLFQREVKWCGRIYNGDGVHHDPTRIEGLVALREPKTVGKMGLKGVPGLLLE